MKTAAAKFGASEGTQDQFASGSLAALKARSG
ncbi:hypothetical protein NB311A_01205 [Nitrobacter sp. Nb-311A]|nr:hypothetical protein NB311A_01205 [Nitrobacter sp. Nb-311A]